VSCGFSVCSDLSWIVSCFGFSSGTSDSSGRSATACMLDSLGVLDSVCKSGPLLTSGASDTTTLSGTWMSTAGSVCKSDSTEPSGILRTSDSMGALDFTAASGTWMLLAGSVLDSAVNL
jgi:hypothetical protein